MRDRLIELLKNSPHLNTLYGCEWGESADWLLANGVVVPPVSVGQKVYQTSGNYCGEKIFEGVVAHISIYNNGEIRCWMHGYPYGFTFDDIGETVFLTREQAEAKLKEGKG